MKNKSILYRFGLVVLVVLLLVLILPSSKIDLASKISASTQASVRAEHQQNFASSNEMEFEVYSSSDEIYQNISEVLSGVRCVRRLSQNYSSYSHEFPVDSITVSYYDDAEQHQLLLHGLFRRGVHPEQCLCLGQIPRRRGRRAVSGACGDRGINRSFSI